MFFYGVGVGTYQWFPYGGLQALYRATLPATSETPDHREGHASVDDELLRFAFTRELSRPLLREPTKSLDGVLEFNESIHTPVELLFDAAAQIEILGTRELKIEEQVPILVTEFLFAGMERRAYAYGSLSSSDTAAVLMIPGSGENKARRIVSSDPGDYHCCLYDALSDFNRFVLIKPNEGLRAVHDGVGRLHESFIVNWHLNRGSSYSAAYIVEAVALTLVLAQHAEKFAVVGLSQGGEAALLAALLNPPDAAVIASGYSAVSADLALWSGHDQIIIPGVSALTESERIEESLDFSSLFSYGRSEVGTYRTDAETGRTCTALEQNDAIECVIHDGGHEFPVPEVVEFLHTWLFEGLEN